MSIQDERPAAGNDDVDIVTSISGTTAAKDLFRNLLSSNQDEPMTPHTDSEPRSLSTTPYRTPSLYADERMAASSSRSQTATSTPSLPHSNMSTPPPPSTGSKKQQNNAPQLIGDLPVARNEALRTFTEIGENVYQYKSLGRHRELAESMTCDCDFSPNVDDPEVACGHDSNCINRLTQVECLAEDCACGRYCRNQRFQKKQYAPIQIVKTPMKGYGLRAEEDLERDQFIYEYVGDVVSNASFKKRMRDYANEGIEHFYFMMLQKDEFIDATKSGGIGRFANHSCNPNCHVAKWQIGPYVRMGIFAKRKIMKHEELTFNYNVDRYGHQAQTCYCGEPNCVGFIGGKTQTDISTMDDLYLDALGITDEEDLKKLKGSRKHKGKKIDDPDFMPQMKPIILKEVPKVVQAIRQVSSRKVLMKILSRIKMTEADEVRRQIMRLRGYSLMNNLLLEHLGDNDVLVAVLESMQGWPLVNRNKVVDSGIMRKVEDLCTKSEGEAETDSGYPELVTVPAKKLLDHWSSLTLAYRIPKKAETVQAPVVRENKPQIYIEIEEKPTTSAPVLDWEAWRQEKAEREAYMLEKRRRERERETIEDPPPEPVKLTDAERALYLFKDRQAALAKEREEAKFDRKSNMWSSVTNPLAIIAAATEKAAADAAAVVEASIAAEKAAQKAEKDRVEREERRAKRKNRPPKKTLSTEEKAASREKRMLKLVGAVVVKAMSKHTKTLDRELFKKHAKELTQMIADKEKKSSTYNELKLDALPDAKIHKIKKHAHEYMEKLMRKIEKSSHRKRTHSSSTIRESSSSTILTASSSTMVETPDADDESGDGKFAEMTVEEAMDMDMDVDDGEDVDMGEDSQSEDEDDIPASPYKVNGSNSLNPEAMEIQEDPDGDAGSLTNLAMAKSTDPRRRLIEESAPMG